MTQTIAQLYFVKFTHLENRDNNITGLFENSRNTYSKNNNTLKKVKHSVRVSYYKIKMRGC